MLIFHLRGRLAALAIDPKIVLGKQSSVSCLRRICKRKKAVMGVKSEKVWVCQDSKTTGYLRQEVTALTQKE